MTTSYTPILQLALPATGELNGSWGDVVNNNITSMVEQAIAGLATINTWTAASHTLTTANGTTDEARCAVLECSGVPGAAASVICPAFSKIYIIKNAVTGGYAVTLKTASGTGISVPNGTTAVLYCDGTNVVSGSTYMASLVAGAIDNTPIGATTPSTGAFTTLSATSVTDSGLTSGRITYAGTGGLLQDSANLTFNGTAATLAGQLNLTNASNYNLYASGAGANYMLGALGIGTTSLTQFGLRVGKNITGNSGSYGVRSDGIVQSDVTSQAYYFNSAATTAAASFTVGQIQHFSATQGTFGSGSTVTSQYGFIANSSLTGATLNYGFYSNIASGTGRYNFYAAGTADNAFAGTTNLGGLPGAQSFQAYPVTSAVNYLQAQGGTTGNPPALYAQGSDTNVGISYASKGSGTHTFFVSGYTALRIDGGSSAQNFLQIYSNPSSYILNFGGNDTNVNVTYASKGNGFHNFQTGGGTQFLITHTASAVNYLVATGAVATGSPTIQPAGSDTNIGLAYLTKGSANHTFYTNGFGSPEFVIAHTASAVNYLQVTGGATGVGATLSSQGSDTNVGMTLQSKGTYSINLATGGLIQAAITNTASAVNYVVLTGGATGSPATVAVQGSDTNVDLALVPQGTGAVRTSSQLTLSNASGYALYASGAGKNYMAGALGIGAVPASTAMNLYGANNATGAATLYGIFQNSQIQSDVTGAYYLNMTQPTTAAASFTLPSLNHYRAQQGTFGAGSTVANQYGFFAAGSLTGATNNYGFYGSIVAATGRYNFYAAGSADNVFVGNTYLGGLPGIQSLLVAFNISSVNYLQVTGGATGSPVTLSAAGSDTNVDLALVPQGTGVVKYGTYTAGVLTPAGYITIKDAGGTSRRILIG
jgi:hypothetical protein